MALDMQSLLTRFNSPEFQQAWAYSDRSAASLGLNPEEYEYLKASGFQPFQPNAQTNIQQSDGVWKNTFVQPGETPKQFEPVTSAPLAAPTNLNYAQNIGQTLPGGTSSILPPKPAAPAPATNPLVGGGSSAPQSTNPWETQPKPANSLVGGRGSQFGQLTGGTPPPPTGFVPITADDPFFSTVNAGPAAAAPPAGAVTSTADRARRDNAYVPGPTYRGNQLADIQSYAPPTTTPPGGGGSAPGPGPGGGGGLPPGANPTGPPVFGEGSNNAGNGGYAFPKPFSYDAVQDFTQNPAYQARLKESERALNRRLLSMGRGDSTGAENAFATNARRLAGEFEQTAYDRALGENMTAYDRALTINKLTYDRAYQENVLNYEREFRENERRYGREMAENILAYERQFREDAREYERVRWLVENGLVGGTAA